MSWHQGDTHPQAAQQDGPKLRTVGQHAGDPVPRPQSLLQQPGSKPPGHGLDVSVGEPPPCEGALQGRQVRPLSKPRNILSL